MLLILSIDLLNFSPWGVESRGFHTSLVRFQRPSHRLYGLIDWDRVESGLYAIVDPFDPNHILYISEYDYIIQVRVCQTNNKNLIVLATPEDKRTDTPSQNSPVLDPFFKSFLYGNQTSVKRLKKRLPSMFSSPFERERIKKDGEDESMVKLTRENVSTFVTKWFNILHWWRRGSTMTIVSKVERNTFALTCQQLFRNNGTQFLILKLKACLFAVNSYLSGKKLRSDQVPGKVRLRMSRNGLPIMLPYYARRAIKCHNLKFIHIWTSVLNMYKGFEGTYDKIDISSIVQSHPDFTYNHHFHAFTQYLYTVFWYQIRDKLRGKLHVNFTVKHLFSTSKAGPAHESSMLGASRDAFVWFNPDEATGISSNYILDWLEMTKDERIKDIFLKAAWAYEVMTDRYGLKFPKVAPSKVKRSGTIYSAEDGSKEFIIEDRRSQKKILDRSLLPLIGYGRLTNREDETPRILGRLAPIYEPAGKIRVVAIIDYWTNMVLKPLHDWMFDILRVIPTDATFDQEGTLKTFVSKGHKDCWSIDLTAATDTIPIALYMSLLIPVIGKDMTELWTKLLIGRNFLHRFAPKSERNHSKGDSSYDLVRYERGQPMGALSSWPSMALVHHALVQYSAFTVEMGARSPMAQFEFLRTATPREVNYLPWYQDYLILGDDLVIFDIKVAEQYLLIAEALGLKVGMTKSFISDKGFVNFASQSFVDDINHSPISFKQFIGVNSLYKRVSMTRKLIERGWIDISSHKWLAPLVKTFFNNERPWTKVQEFYYKGKVHPIIPWILSALLVPGRAISSIGITRVSIRCPLSFLKSEVIWNKPIESLKEGTMECMRWNTISRDLLRSLDEVDNKYLSSLRSLKKFDTWLSETMSPESYELLRIVLHDQVLERLQIWGHRNRIPLARVRDRILSDSQPEMNRLSFDEISVLLDKRAQALPMFPGLVTEPINTEHEDPVVLMGTDDYVNFITQALETLPTVPDYGDPSFSMEPIIKSHPDRSEEMERFSNFLATTGIAEHMFNFISPGFDRSIMTNQSKLRKAVHGKQQ